MHIKDIPTEIRNRINEKDMTIKAVAERAGIVPQALSAMLNHRQSIPADTFIALCRVLDCTPEDFID